MKKSILITLIINLVAFTVSAQGNIRPPTTGHNVATVNTPNGPANYYFGGKLDNGQFSGELWVEQDGEFAQLLFQGDGPEPRIDFGMFYDPTSNSICIFGGVDENGNFLYDFWSFDRSTGKWTEHIGGTGSGKAKTRIVHDSNYTGWVMAGGESSGGNSLDQFQKFEITPSSFSLVPLPAMPEPLQGGGIAYKNDKVFYVGGKNNDWDPSTPGSQPSYSKNTWVFKHGKNNPVGYWEFATTTGNFDELTDFAFVADANYLFVYGGKSYNYQTNTEFLTNKVFKLNLNTLQWEQVATLPFTIAEATAAFTKNSNTIWIVGGITMGTSSTPTVSDKIIEFNTLTNTYTVLTLTGIPSAEVRENLKIVTDLKNQLLILPEIIAPVQAEIYTIAGQRVYKGFSANQSIDISHLSGGIYILKIHVGNKTYHSKFSK